MGRLFAGFGCIWLAVAIVTVIAWVQGIVMVFKASVVLGIVCIFLEIPFPLESVCYWLTHYDIAQHVARALGLS